MTDDTFTFPTCGEVIGEPCGFEVECQLPLGHGGDEHFAIVRWPVRETPRPGEDSLAAQIIRKTWEREILRALNVSTR